jgi:PKD repeat protein
MNSGRRIQKVFLLALILTTWAFVSVGCASVEEPQVEWSKTFGGSNHDYGYSVRQTNDGGYIIVGDKSIVFAKYDVYLIKTNENGSEEWSKTYGRSDYDTGYSVQQTADEGYVIVGSTYRSLGDYDFWLIKTDSTGIQEWSKVFSPGGSWEWEEGRSVQQTSDGGYIITGGYYNTYLLKTTEYGNLDWSKMFSGGEGYSVQQTSDGGYIIVNGNGLIKTDENGTVEWSKMFGSGKGYAVQQTLDGGYIIGGTSYKAEESDVYLTKTDRNGTEEWNKTFGGTDFDRAYSVQQSIDEGYIITGYTNSFGTGESDIYLIKTDRNGTEEWNKTLGGASWEEGRSVQQTSDGGYIVGGSTSSYGAGGWDVWLIKIKSLIQPPTAIIDSITPNLARQGKDTVFFIGHGNDSDGSIVAYNWTSSIDGLLNTSPSFTKSASELSVGTHTISFSVQDDDGAWSSAATENLTIMANQPPVASFTYSPVNPGINETVTFNASASYDSDGSIVSYYWSFGDGNFTNTTELSVIHSYASVSWYLVILNVIDDGGATNTTLQVLQVSLKPPIATFSCSPPNPVVNETVTFNASESYDPNGVITTYEFEFGDGANATGEEVTHSYSSVGMYTVNLTLTDNEGATNRTSHLLKVFSNISSFDTEPGTYPSISGTHNGTITMTHTVNVSKICVYPCAGTGGHIEYAKIWNASWDGTEAHWHGYVDDWQNLPFDTNFTLFAGETYYYTIITDSYPQIHHAPELLTGKGWITCTEFTDVNGKRYNNWIPAIRLF